VFSTQFVDKIKTHYMFNKVFPKVSFMR